MTKKLLVIPFVLALLTGVPAISYANNSTIEIIDNEYQEISISVKYSTLQVTGANGQMLYVYNVAGVRVMNIRVDGQDRHYDLNLPKGCYIVKVGKTFVRKIFIK